MMADINQNKTNDAEIAKIKDRVLKASLKKEQAAWEEVLGRESGRRVLWELMKEFGLYKYCFDPNGSKMGENVARQGCAQYIKNRIAFWAGGVTNVLLWACALGRLSPEVVYNTLIWPYHAIRYLLGS